MKNRQRARRISLNENHNKYLGTGSGSSIDVQIFTNTKEPNQVNLNSSSKLLATTVTTTSAEAALPASLPVAQIAQQQHLQQQHLQRQQLQQQQQLIMPPTMMMGKYFPSHAKLRKCKSTPSLNFDGLEPMEPMEEDPHCHRISLFPRNTASEAKQTQQHEQLSRITSNEGSCNSNSNSNISNKCNSNATPTTPESLRFGCAHYKRRAMFVVSAISSQYTFISAVLLNNKRKQKSQTLQKKSQLAMHLNLNLHIFNQ